MGSLCTAHQGPAPPASARPHATSHLLSTPACPCLSLSVATPEGAGHRVSPITSLPCSGTSLQVPACRICCSCSMFTTPAPCGFPQGLCTRCPSSLVPPPPDFCVARLPHPLGSASLSLCGAVLTPLPPRCVLSLPGLLGTPVHFHLLWPAPRPPERCLPRSGVTVPPRASALAGTD